MNIIFVGTHRVASEAGQHPLFFIPVLYRSIQIVFGIFRRVTCLIHFNSSFIASVRVKSVFGIRGGKKSALGVK